MFDSRWMKGCILGAGCLLLTGAGASEEVDYAQVNETIRSALNEVMLDFETIEATSYSIDLNRTDIANDEYGIDWFIVLKQTPWGEAGVSAEYQLDLQTDRDDPETRGFTMSIQGEVQADALSLLKYKVKSVSQCELASDHTGVRGVLWQRHCEYVERLDEVRSVKELHAFLAEKITQHKTDINAYIASLELAQIRQMLESANGDRIDRLMAEQLDHSRDALQFLNGISLETVANGFKISSDAFDQCPVLGINGLTMVVSENQIDFVGKFTLKFGKSVYVAARPVIKDMIAGLETNEDFARKHVQFDMRILDGLILQAIDVAGEQ